MRLAHLLAVDAQRAWRVADSCRQQHHQADVVDLDIANTVKHQVVGDLLGTVGPSITHLDVDPTMRRLFATQIEIGTMHSAT